MSPGDSRGARLSLIVALLVAVALRVSTAVHRSLWLDEFHSLHHALQPTVGALLASLRQDNHPPGCFLLLQAWTAFTGSGQVAIRVPAILASAATVWLAARLARRLAGPFAGAVAAAVVALSSLNVLLGAEARMYALLALCVCGLLEALTARLIPTGADEQEALPRSLPWRAGAWIALGCLTHYWFLHHLALVALALTPWLVCDPRLRRGLRPRDLLPLAVALLVVVPWYATGFREQLLEHSLRPGASQVTPVRIAQSYLLLLFYNLGTLSAALRWTLASAGAGLLALAVLGAGQILLRGSPGARAAASTVAATALLLEPWAGLVASAFPRAGFSWTYLSGAVPALAVLIGAGLAPVSRRPRAWITAALLVALGVGATIESLGAGTENLRGAVEHVLEVRRPGDAVLPVEWQPGFFPHGQAWRYYGAPRAPDLPVLEHDADYGLLAFPVDPPPQRVHVQLRGLPHEAPLMVALRERYAREEAVPFGFGVFVVTFSQPR